VEEREDKDERGEGWVGTVRESGWIDLEVSVAHVQLETIGRLGDNLEKFSGLVSINYLINNRNLKINTRTVTIKKRSWKNHSVVSFSNNKCKLNFELNKIISFDKYII